MTGRPGGGPWAGLPGREPPRSEAGRRRPGLPGAPRSGWSVSRAGLPSSPHPAPTTTIQENVGRERARPGVEVPPRNGGPRQPQGRPTCLRKDAAPQSCRLPPRFLPRVKKLRSHSRVFEFPFISKSWKEQRRDWFGEQREGTQGHRTDSSLSPSRIPSFIPPPSSPCYDLETHLGTEQAPFVTQTHATCFLGSPIFWEALLSPRRPQNKSFPKSSPPVCPPPPTTLGSAPPCLFPL